MSRTKTTLIASLAAISVLAASVAALAAPAVSTVSLNVRSGPGTTFNVLDTLHAGEAVEVTECVSNGWCRVEHSGPDGWVSSSYLAAPTPPAPPPPPPPAPAPDSNCSFGIVIGPSGPTFSLNCGDSPPPPPPAPPPPPPPPVVDQACFYTGANYTGSEFCHGPATLNTLDFTFNDQISSFKLFGNAKVQLCDNANLGGSCITRVNSRPTLNASVDNRASSLRIFLGALPPPPPPPPPPGPVTHSTGPISLHQTGLMNLDNGNTSGGGRDIWYEAVSPLQKFFTPRNGARISFVNGAQRGFAGCSTAAYSANRVSLWLVPPGSYVCVKTNQGRFSEFRLNSYTGTTMNIGYTTWAN